MPNYTWSTITSDENTIASLLNEKGEFTFEKFIPMPKELKRTISGGRIAECVAYYLLKTYSFADAKEKISKFPKMFVFSYYERKTKKETMDDLFDAIGDNPRMFNDEEHTEERKDENGRWRTYVINEDYGHTPEEIGEYYYKLYEKYGCIDWYTWANKYWGTKWNAFDVNVNKTCISFTTAWSSPEPILAKISQICKNAKIEFSSEYEKGYLIEASNHNGEYIVDSSWHKEFDEDEDGCIDYDTRRWINDETGEEMDY